MVCVTGSDAAGAAAGAGAATGAAAGAGAGSLLSVLDTAVLPDAQQQDIHWRTKARGATRLEPHPIVNVRTDLICNVLEIF